MQNILKNYFKKTDTATLIAVMALAFGFASLGAMVSPAAGAQGIESNICEGAELSLEKANSNSCSEATAGAETRLERVIGQIVNIISIIVGIIAVIMIIIGGAKFIASGGDSGKISSARSTVIYAIVGLIIVALAQVIVRFVLGKV